VQPVVQALSPPASPPLSESVESLRLDRVTAAVAAAVPSARTGPKPTVGAAAAAAAAAAAGSSKPPARRLGRPDEVDDAAPRVPSRQKGSVRPIDPALQAAALAAGAPLSSRSGRGAGMRAASPQGLPPPPAGAAMHVDLAHGGGPAARGARRDQRSPPEGAG
jgi:hypothetical protein